jgi:hypothetical protein
MRVRGNTDFAAVGCNTFFPFHANSDALPDLLIGNGGAPGSVLINTTP